MSKPTEKRWTLLHYTHADKWVTIMDNDGILLRVDYDDVDHGKVDAFIDWLSRKLEEYPR